MINAKVTFKYGKQGNSATSNTGIPVASKTESAVMEALKKRYPSYTNIIILNIE